MSKWLHWDVAWLHKGRAAELWVGTFNSMNASYVLRSKSHVFNLRLCSFINWVIN
jgi:hypothetical protein